MTKFHYQKKYLIFFFAVTLLSMLGFILPNRFSGQSSDVLAMDREKQVLQEEIKSLDLELISLKSLMSISNRASSIGMCQVEEIWYVEPAESLASL